MSSSSSPSSFSTLSPAKHPSNPPLPWEVLLLISQHLNPKTLAIASCVCKPWFISMSHDHLWKPICLSHYPSLSSLHLVDPTIPYRRLFALGYLASMHRRRYPPEPRISLHDLIFTVDVFCNDARLLSIAEAGEDLDDGRSGVFRFDVCISDDDDRVATIDKEDGVKVAWTVVSKGWKAAFFMMEGKGNGKLVGRNERWFSEELPSPGCCSTTVTSGLVAELGLGFCGGDGKRVVEKVSLGLMSVLSWRYVSVDDGLRYLQHFLLPSNA
ncbi:probable F-box protein At5g04010 [Magnolia sinica]|uniref:probable F-box protein At5g04010 n=1 Tax=Magnolia sinica TaxID=86752 RepID=UPI00265866B0|nr:probable F-box protein At5g04010 [Magnolia sinica]